jgi:hypothetical protein
MYENNDSTGEIYRRYDDSHVFVIKLLHDYHKEQVSAYGK